MDLIHHSPIGPLTIAAERGRLCGLRFGEPHTVDGHAAEADPASRGVLDEARRQLDEYFTGRRRDFDLPLDMRGTAFQQRVWRGLQRIPYGQTISYGELARRLGSAGSSRAVGTANGANPIAIVVPCHRVIASDGTLAGFAGGIETKRRLLDHEAAYTGLFAGAAPLA